MERKSHHAIKRPLLHARSADAVEFKYLRRYKWNLSPAQPATITSIGLGGKIVWVQLGDEEVRLRWIPKEEAYRVRGTSDRYVELSWTGKVPDAGDAKAEEQFRRTPNLSVDAGSRIMVRRARPAEPRSAWMGPLTVTGHSRNYTRIDATTTQEESKPPAPVRLIWNRQAEAYRAAGLSKRLILVHAEHEALTRGVG
jgi:hypothetical protein